MWGFRPLVRRDRSAWLFVLLALVVLVPVACLLWFMNEAVAAQTAAARQGVVDAYRGQLRLVRGRLDERWREFGARLRRSGAAESSFAELAQSQVAEGVVLLDAHGKVEYPRAEEAAADPRVEEILRLIRAAQRVSDADRRRERVAAIAAQLNDYTTGLPPTQRLLAMTRLRAIAPSVRIPTEAALRVSLEVVAAGSPAVESGGFRRTPVVDVWALRSDDGRTVGLYWTGRLEALMHDVLHEVAPEGIVFVAFPPGTPADAEAVAAGDWLPGWQLSFMPIDRQLVDAASRSRVTFYTSVGVAGVVLVTLLGGAAGGAFRRHLRLARLKTDLVAAVSHELRTPLASMRVLVDGLLADPEADARKTRDYLQMMSVENARLSRLIENFLTFSRLERHRHQFIFAPADPAKIVGAALAAIRERVPATCHLRVDVAAALPSVRADADALSTALVNLLDNALKYTPTEKRIDVRAYEDQGTIVFAVQDNGIGIPLGEQRRIFRRFYRVDQRLAGETTGVGLGLSIVDLIVRAHGGSVAVHSESGAGSTFSVRLPRHAGQAAA